MRIPLANRHNYLHSGLTHEDLNQAVSKTYKWGLPNIGVLGDTHPVKERYPPLLPTMKVCLSACPTERPLLNKTYPAIQSRDSVMVAVGSLGMADIVVSTPLE